MNKFFILLLALPSIALAGTENGGNGGDLVGNGGDGQVIEFRNLGLALAEKLRALNGTCQSLIPLRPLDLLNVVYRARIDSSEEELKLQGRRVEAINYPSLNKIIFHSPSFVLNKNKTQLVAHEFLGLLGQADLKDNEEYGLSKFLVELTLRPECQAPVSKRRWIKKKIEGDAVYFQFGLPGEILSYHLGTESQGPTLSAPGPARNFGFLDNTLYLGHHRQVCTASGSCLPGSLVPYLLHDFAIHGNRLLLSIVGFKSAVDFFETSYTYDNVQIASGNSVYSFPLATHPSNNSPRPGDSPRYSLARNFTYLSPNQSIGLVDQFQNDSVTGFSLARFDWARNTSPNGKEVFRNQEIVITKVRHGEELLTSTQRFYMPTISTVPQNLFPAQSGKFVLTDDGSVFAVENLQRVAVLEAPVEDVVSYGEYTILLSAGRLLIYDQAWHLQGEFHPAVAPQGLGIRSDTIYLFSMLSDQKLFVEKQDVTEFFKKKRNCFLSAEEAQKFQPKQIVRAGGEEFAFSEPQGCVLRKDQGWKPWMGMQKNPAATLVIGETLFVVTKNSAVYSLNLKNREETLIARFGMNFVSAKTQNENIELTLHHPAHTKDFLRRVILSPNGKIVGDRWFWAHHEK
jgi:hypothetical protein